MKKSIKSRSRVIITTAIILTFLTVVSFVLVFCLSTRSSDGISGDIVLCLTPAEGERLIYAGSAAPDNGRTNAVQAEVNDNGTVWTTETRVNIFEHNDPHVGNDGTGSANFVIAPGTSNDYVFILRNDKKAPIRYKLEVKGVNDSGYYLPVNVQITGADEQSLTDGFVNIESLDVEKGGALSGHAENAYTLRWSWEYETGDDVHDTMLGDAAVLEEIPCGINIRVVAEYDDNPASEPDGGLVTTYDKPVVTGDMTSIMPVISLILLCGVFILLALRRAPSKKRTDDED